MSTTLLIGDCRDILKSLPDKSVHCCVTSPPYFGLRSYCDTGSSQKALEIGTEQTPEEYVNNLVEVFREVKRVLRDDGTVWLNLGDSYSGSGKGYGAKDHGKIGKHANEFLPGKTPIIEGLKPKDLIGIPWRVAFALQADGWYLRQDIIWQKNNPMPESVKDRVCKSHEYIFLLSKRPRYYFDYIAIQEDAVGNGNKNLQQMQRSSSSGDVQQTQTASRRTARNLQEMPFHYQEDVGQEIQPNGESTRDSQTLLLFREGADCKEDIQRGIRTNGRPERKIPRNEEETREGRKIQSAKETIRSITQWKEDEIKTGYEIYQNGEGEILKTQSRDQTQIPNKINGMHSDTSRVGRNKGEIQSYVCILQETDETVRNGSCNPVVEGGNSYIGECSTSLQIMQCKEGEQTPKRNKRSVWQVNTKPYKGAHFATFPSKLIEPCILAGTSEHGVCSECGSPYIRVTKKTGEFQRRWSKSNADGSPYNSQESMQNTYETVGWQPSCSCNAPSIHATVLDPFAGSGTVGEVCKSLNRNSILIELNPDYKTLIEQRIS